jgi:hypothetical protein
LVAYQTIRRRAWLKGEPMGACSSVHPGRSRLGLQRAEPPCGSPTRSPAGKSTPVNCASTLSSPAPATGSPRRPRGNGDGADRVLGPVLRLRVNPR